MPHSIHLLDVCAKFLPLIFLVHSPQVVHSLQTGTRTTSPTQYYGCKYLTLFGNKTASIQGQTLRVRTFHELASVYIVQSFINNYKRNQIANHKKSIRFEFRNRGIWFELPPAGFATITLIRPKKIIKFRRSQ